jgi:hypothetical protein
MFIIVTIIDIPIETPIFMESLLMNAIPMLIPNDVPINKSVNSHIKNLLSLFLAIGNPTQFHFIYYG